jgi:hypothetical protein
VYAALAGFGVDRGVSQMLMEEHTFLAFFRRKRAGRGRAMGSLHFEIRYPAISLGRFYIAVSKKILDGAKIGICIQHLMAANSSLLFL